MKVSRTGVMFVFVSLQHSLPCTSKGRICVVLVTNGWVEHKKDEGRSNQWNRRSSGSAARVED